MAPFSDMPPSSTRLVTMMVVGGLVFAAIPSTAVATELTVETGNASVITPGSATLNGNLTVTGDQQPINVSFEYWVKGHAQNTRTTVDRSLSEPGEFNRTVSGLKSNTTYVYRARATGTSSTVTGDNVTFSTDARAASQTPFGLQLIKVIRNLGGEDIIGPAVANFTTSHKSGSEKIPDHAGPPDWLKDAIFEYDGNGPGNRSNATGGGAHGHDDGGNRPPGDAGNASSNENGPPGDTGQPEDADQDGNDDRDNEDNRGRGQAG